MEPSKALQRGLKIRVGNRREADYFDNGRRSWIGQKQNLAHYSAANRRE
jgi:hypothetical protein